MVQAGEAPLLHLFTDVLELAPQAINMQFGLKDTNCQAQHPGDLSRLIRTHGANKKA